MAVRSQLAFDRPSQGSKPALGPISDDGVSKFSSHHDRDLAEFRIRRGHNQIKIRAGEPLARSFRPLYIRTPSQEQLGVRP